MFDYTATYTDQYQLTMAQAYFLKGHGKKRAVFDYFFRKVPFAGGYAVFTGLEDLLEVLQNLRFDKADLEFLAGQGFDPGFLKHLERFRFRGDVHSSREGDLIFPTRPVLQVEGNLIEAQIVETRKPAGCAGWRGTGAWWTSVCAGPTDPGAITRAARPSSGVSTRRATSARDAIMVRRFLEQLPIPSSRATMMS
jgi:hypothetical protein